MADFDVFNGDADGICALIQLRLAEPRDAVLVTGVKRDIALLSHVEAGAGDRVTVLDISMEKNSAALNQLLARGAEVFYVDHHVPGTVPASPLLKVLINEAPEACTSTLVDGHLQGAFRRWAVVGAFGDNLKRSAQALAARAALSDEQVQQLEKLGTYVNYNGYGASEADLHFAPAALYQQLSRFDDPLAFIAADRETFGLLEAGFHGDMALARAVQPLHADATSALFVLPDQPWARRVSGVFSNELVNRFPDRAHAVLTEQADGTYLVSVRAPLNNRRGAAELCKEFPTGGGRAAAAGINALPAAMLDRFIERLRETWR
ncbi:MAG: DHH family phosphoesterase [Spongiibacteraceae bacterium]|jgi:hypothetical protein|nr:DHH family phosphoesterase [Spongiibacteraceae bacterium]